MRKIITILAICFVPTLLQAQEIEMADTMRSEGKIYVVVAILLVILIGLIAYLIILDRKLSRAEKNLAEKLRK